MPRDSKCLVCGSSDVSVFFESSGAPVQIGVLWASKEAAQDCPKGDIKLAFCKHCGFIWNQSFDSSYLQYTQAYDNSLHFSPFYSEYARSTALGLIERYDLHNKHIIELGCGKGDFLLLLCKLGSNYGVGFDPTYEARDIDSETAERITFVRDLYSEKYTSYQGDLICSRYVFEHIQNPVGFLNMVRRSIGDRTDTVVYFEVPDVYLILQDLSIWDIIYEHCSYFGPAALAYVFQSCGFDILKLTETFNQQFIGIEVSPGTGENSSSFDLEQDLKKLSQDVENFIPNYQTKLQRWQSQLQDIVTAGKRAVVWGAGAKGVSFLNMLNVQEQLEYIVDINPNKNGKYIPGTGQKIVSPEFLRDEPPDLVIVMNPNYKHEIEKSLQNMGITTKVMVV